jgi:FAD/FMN-containing dehydrogenase
MASTSTTMLTTPSSSVIWRDDPKYEEARVGRVFNHRRPDRYPNGVVEATCVDDVVNAVKLAKEMNLRVSVRSGGHSWAAWSVRDNAILVDLGKLKCMEMDESTNIVRVSPSTTGRILNSFLATKGKMFGGGHCPDVGLGGFLLQGGMGWNCRVSLLQTIYRIRLHDAELGLGLRENRRHRSGDR